MTYFWMYGSQEGFGLAELYGSGSIHSERAEAYFLSIYCVEHFVAFWITY